jgi:hypothetical protein
MKFIVFFSVSVLSCAGFGCSSPTSISNSAANSTSNITASVNNSTNVAAPLSYNSANGAPVDANAATSGNANQTQVKVITPPAGNPKPMTFPAPDDSEYSSSMNKSGQAVETRVFHSDPSISKVERIWKDVNDKVVNIYLKNGKVVKVPGDKWPEIKSQPVSVFYEAAGVKPSQPAVKGTPAVRKEDKPKQ